MQNVILIFSALFQLVILATASRSQSGELAWGEPAEGPNAFIGNLKVRLRSP